jgi:hypothetical protein
MRVLVIGTLPPPRLPRSASLLAYVDRLESAGDEVLVVPVGVGPTGRRTGGISGRAGLDVLLAALLRRRGSDRLVLQVEPALAGSLDAGRLRRAASLSALAGALAGWRDVEVRLESFDDLPGGVGGRAAAALWARATRVVVPTSEQREALHSLAGVALDRVEVEPRPAGEVAGQPAWPTGDAVSRDSVLAVVRRRAAADRVESGWHRSPAVARLLAESGASPASSPYGPFEPVVRYVYERPALRDPVRRFLRFTGRRPAVPPSGTGTSPSSG